jgi:beta-glucanase (GH16 family)
MTGISVVARRVGAVAVRALRNAAVPVLILFSPSAPTHGAGSPKTLDIAAFHETFSEDFRGKLDVTRAGPSKWIAHTPWGGDFGDATFADPQPGFPFETGPGGLAIIARKDGKGRWNSGLLSSTDAQNRGFSQADGYFEARMKMPAGPGTWPAFWLVSHSDPTYHCEIDIIEYYGHGMGWYQIALHLWPKSPSAKLGSELETIKVRDHSLVEAFHTYGVEITHDDIIFYLDRVEVARMAAPVAAHQPMSMLVDLALGSGWPIDKTPDPSILYVDYIKAFAPI